MGLFAQIAVLLHDLLNDRRRVQREFENGDDRVANPPPHKCRIARPRAVARSEERPER